MKDQTENQITRLMKIAIEVGILLFAVALAWATLRGNVKENTKDIEKHDVRIIHIEKETYDTKGDIREIRIIQSVIGDYIKELKENKR